MYMVILIGHNNNTVLRFSSIFWKFVNKSTYVRVLRHFTITTQETPEMKYKENFGETIFGRIFEGSLVVGRWSVGGR